MSETPVPDAAVQIAAEAIARSKAITSREIAGKAAAALAAAGWLHDPAEVAALRAELAAVDEAEGERKVECPGANCPASFASRVPFEAERQLVEHHRRTHPHPLLDALPSADGAPTQPQGETREREGAPCGWSCSGVHERGTGRDRDECTYCDAPLAPQAGPAGGAR